MTRHGRATALPSPRPQVLGVSVDSQFTHLAWIQTDRKNGGLGDLAYPLVADLKKEISSHYGVLTPDGIALRGLFIIDKARRWEGRARWEGAGLACCLPLFVCRVTALVGQRVSCLCTPPSAPTHAPTPSSPPPRPTPPRPPPPQEGVVQHSTINNLGFGRSVDETLRVLQAIQYIQSHPDEARLLHALPGPGPRDGGESALPVCCLFARGHGNPTAGIWPEMSASLGTS